MEKTAGDGLYWRVSLIILKASRFLLTSRPCPQCFHGNQFWCFYRVFNPPKDVQNMWPSHLSDISEKAIWQSLEARTRASPDSVWSPR